MPGELEGSCCGREECLLEVETEADRRSVQILLGDEFLPQHRVAYHENEEPISAGEPDVLPWFPVGTEVGGVFRIGTDAEAAAFKRPVQFELSANPVVRDADDWVPHARFPA